MTEQHARLNLLDTALEYHASGWPVVPVDAKKRPLCKWGGWQSKQQMETEVREIFSRAAHGIALLTWPASDLVVLDFDGPHADEIWKSTGIPLPMTTQNRTQSGWQHRIFRVPPGAQRPEHQTTERELKRSIRLVGEEKACGANGTKSCGVDLLLKGYFIVPPTPGYREDPDYPLQPGSLAVIPPEVIRLAQQRNRNAPVATTDDKNWVIEALRGPIPEGQRNDTAARLAGFFLVKGHSADHALALLEAWARTACVPPMGLQELHATVQSVARREASRRRQEEVHTQTRTRPGAVSVQPGPPEKLPIEAPETDTFPFPDMAFQGLAAEIAYAYAERVEAPPAFLFLDALTFLGIAVSTFVRLESLLREEPRLYVVKVGPSWSGRKSSSQDLIEDLYAPLLQDRVILCYGAGSAEGLAKRMQSGLPTLLVYDEFRSFVDKSGVQGSVLLPMVGQLFSRTVYENSTRNSEIRLPDAHLSLLGACTTETFTTMFNPSFRNIGFLNRLLIVEGKRTTLKPIPESLPPGVVGKLQERTRAQIERAERERPALRFTADARRRWEEWYRALPENPYTPRLDTYGFRLLMLYAVTTESWEITRPLVDAVIALLDYELAVRKELDPVDAEGATARMERLILRHLNKGRMYEARLQKLCNVRHYGVWVFEQAMKNVIAQGWVKSARVGRGLNRWLTEAGNEAAGDH